MLDKRVEELVLILGAVCLFLLARLPWLQWLVGLVCCLVEVWVFVCSSNKCQCYVFPASINMCGRGESVCFDDVFISSSAVNAIS